MVPPAWRSGIAVTVQGRAKTGNIRLTGFEAVVNIADALQQFVAYGDDFISFGVAQRIGTFGFPVEGGIAPSALPAYVVPERFWQLCQLAVQVNQ